VDFLRRPARNKPGLFYGTQSWHTTVKHQAPARYDSDKYRRHTRIKFTEATNANNTVGTSQHSHSPCTVYSPLCRWCRL